jgi:hypothetical protein
LSKVLRKRVSLDDFKDVEIKILHQMEKEFENQLDHYFKLVDMANFDF